MLFVLKYALKHIGLFLLSALLLEVALPLIQDTPQGLQGIGDLAFQASTHFFKNLAELQLESLVLFKWAFWLFSNKIYYLLLMLVILVFCYNYKNKNLEEPPNRISKRLSSDQYQQLKKAQTERSLKELKQSHEFKVYRQNLLLGKIRSKQDDQTVQELREKEDELF